MSRRRILLSLVGIAGVITVFSSSVFGQIDSATIQGIVHDEQGGIIPGVEIVVTNVQTNERFQTLTNDHGFYAAPKLKIGQYQVQASLSGFKTGVRSGITLEVQKVARIDFTLQIGEISETVTITGETSLLESEKAAVGQVIESHAIANLPLNGRSYVQLARLAVGVIEPPRGDRGGDDGFVANGVKAQLNDFRLDGIDNNARTPGVQQRTYAVVRPALDSIQEFRVETHNFSAEYGRAAGAVVNASIKSGTNAFHGSLFEFHRNDNLDARDFFADPDDAKPFLLLNQFGGTIGGPLVHDHTFFLFSFGASRERRGDTIVSTVPTEAMRRGDFSGIPETIFDPATTRRNPAGKGFIRDPFAGKQIPPNRLDPVAKRVMDEFLLMPNRPGLANNFVLSPNEKRDIERYTTRIDTNLTDRDRLFGRYIIIDRTFIFARPFWVGRARKDAARSQSLAIGETHTFSPTVVNQLRLGYSRLNPIRDVLVEEQLFEQFGFKGINPAPDVHGLPGLNISGFVRLGNGAFQPNQKIPESYIDFKKLKKELAL